MESAAMKAGVDPDFSEIQVANRDHTPALRPLSTASASLIVGLLLHSSDSRGCYTHAPVPTFRENLRLLPRPVWILFGGTFINRFGSFVMPFLVLFMTGKGYTPAQAGLAVSAYGIGHLVASMTGGHLADRIGRRHTIVISMFGSAMAMMALSQARGYVMLLVMTFFAGALAELYRPAALALISDPVRPRPASWPSIRTCICSSVMR
jgi:predicted MFS family arabinose efflux permease